MSEKITKEKIWYCGTTLEHWNNAKKTKYLSRTYDKFLKKSYIHLTNSIVEAKEYGEVILKVKYDPITNFVDNSYQPGDIDIKVFNNIPIKDISVL